MTQRITFRLDKDLEKLLDMLPDKLLFNISSLIREALKDKLNKITSIDNSAEKKDLEKDVD